MERATLSSCAKGTAMEDARNHEAECATPRVGDGFGTRCPGSVNGGAGTLHTPVLETLASGPRAGVRPRVTDGGGGKADDRAKEKKISGRRGGHEPNRTFPQGQWA